MCSRFVLKTKAQALADLFKVEKTVDWNPRYNVAPSQAIPAIVHPMEDKKKSMRLLRWGFVASWVQGGRLLINAQSENIQEKPLLKESFEKWRCLIPVDGFYEWRHEARETRPHYIKMKNNKPFALAGLWAPQEIQGEKIESAVILTTTPNELVRTIHERMPVIVHEKNYKLWLDSDDVRDFETIQKLFEPYPAEEMEAYEVSHWVNDTLHDEPRCIEPFQEPRTIPLPF